MHLEGLESAKSKFLRAATKYPCTICTFNTHYTNTQTAPNAFYFKDFSFNMMASFCSPKLKRVAPAVTSINLYFFSSHVGIFQQ